MTQADDAGTTPALTAADLDTAVNCEPRILDTVLGTHLGMAQPLNIRAVIEASRGELGDYGTIFTQRVKNPGRGRPGTAFYLTEGQALCVCALSRAPNAPQVRRALIEAFMELRRRQVKALVPPAQEMALVAKDPSPALMDIFAAACKTLNGWSADGVVRDRDAALWVAFRATLKAAGIDATFRRAPAPRRRPPVKQIP